MNERPETSLETFFDRQFGLTQNGTTVRTEFIAGVTTFLTMIYIVFVNPTILANAGMDKGAVFVATCLAAAVSTLAMAFLANYPIALAPGMGLNAFFAFTVVLGYKYTWQQALAAVFCSGAIFFALTFSGCGNMSLTPFRETSNSRSPQASVFSSRLSRSNRQRSSWRVRRRWSPWDRSASRIPRPCCACSDLL